MSGDIGCWFSEGVPDPTHLSLLIWVSILSCSALSHSTPFLMTSGQWMPMMDLRHLLTKSCSFLEVSLVALRVSEQYRRTNFTLVLNILNLVFLDITFDLHTGLNIAKQFLPSQSLPGCPTILADLASK